MYVLFRDPLLICDSSSEVSDEGYKSSHGNVSKLETPQQPPNLQAQGEGQFTLFSVICSHYFREFIKNIKVYF